MIPRSVTLMLRAAGALACVLLMSGPLTPAEGTPAPRPGPPDLPLLLPEQVLGYAPLEKDGLYTAETLFDLIDGGAEVYRSFNVRRVVSRRYGRSGAPDLMADLFDMGSSRDAFGAYHHDIRDGRELGVGMESELSGGSLCFWKDQYFVSLVALADTTDTRQAVQALAHEIARRIPELGAKPEILDLLPAEGLQRDRLSYFHDWIYLNTRQVIAEENLLLLDGETEGILARYRGAAAAPGREGRFSHLLLLARYRDGERARKAAESFLAAYLPGADRRGVARRRDGRWAAAQAEGDLVVVVLDAAERPDMKKLMSAVKRARARMR